MFVSDYYILRDELDLLDFQVPQRGIKFRYGDFTVQHSGKNGQEMYMIRKDDNNFINFLDYMVLYPKPDSVGFMIHEMTMSFNTAMKFINEVRPQETSEQKVQIHKGMYSQLLRDSKSLCLICCEEYGSTDDIHIYKCAHNIHKKCFEMSDTIQFCPLCKK